MYSAPSDINAILTREARQLAARLLETADRKGLNIATAESCTGGLLSTILTDVPGVSHCFECGFVVYSDSAKSRLLGISPELLEIHGAVSKPVAIEMAEKALERCKAQAALSITGFAGPGGAGDEEGLVHFAVARDSQMTVHREEHFGPSGRDRIRTDALQTGLQLLAHSVEAA